MKTPSFLGRRAAVQAVAFLALIGSGACVDLNRPPGFPNGLGGVSGAASGGSDVALPGLGGSAAGGGGGNGGEPGLGGMPGDMGGASGMSDPLGMGGVLGMGGMPPMGGGGTAGAMGGSGGADTAGPPDLPPDMVVMKLGLGAACASATQCAGNFCVDGVCCDSACSGVCRTCSLGPERGVCATAATGTDPRSSCPDDGASTCGRTGMCDASGACARYAAATVCSPLACNASAQVTISRCDAAGACVPNVQNCAPYGCTSTGSCRTTCFQKSDCAGAAECFSGTCGGLLGTYFDRQDFTGRTVTRTDRDVNFDWQGSAPAPTMPVDAFSIRWTGQITPRFNETTTFYVVSDDGVRLWVDGQLLINDLRQHALEETSGAIALRAGKTVTIRLDYMDVDRDAVVRLSWSSPSISRQIIPSSVLKP